MKNIPILTYFFLTLLIGCDTQPSQEFITIIENEEINEVVEEKDNLSEIPVVNSEESWEETQDSLRHLMLSKKINKRLKKSILKELYLRGLVHVRANSLYVDIAFNLHAFDCGAPDNYSTNLSFWLPFSKNKKLFPDTIRCLEEEHDHDIVFNMNLCEETDSVVVYKSNKLKRMLFIFRSCLLYTSPSPRDA